MIQGEIPLTSTKPHVHGINSQISYTYMGAINFPKERQYPKMGTRQGKGRAGKCMG